MNREPCTHTWVSFMPTLALVFPKPGQFLRTKNPQKNFSGPIFGQFPAIPRQDPASRLSPGPWTPALPKPWGCIFPPSSRLKVPHPTNICPKSATQSAGAITRRICHAKCGRNQTSTASRPRLPKWVDHGSPLPRRRKRQNPEVSRPERSGIGSARRRGARKCRRGCSTRYGCCRGIMSPETPCASGGRKNVTFRYYSVPAT